jgi:UDPglucose 6-dehydrogenase
MIIGIIGLGVVGSANKYGFKKIGHTVLEHDIKLKTKIENLIKTRIIFLCVPTPSKKNGSCNTSIVESVLKDLHGINYKGIICIRSSTEPGFTEKVIKKYKNNRICFVPEFLRERMAKKDFIKNHELLAVGTKSKKIFKEVVRAHGKLPKNTKMLSPTEAEVLKYYINVFASLRVTFANIFFEICQKFNCDYEKIKNSYIATGRGSPNMYLSVTKNLRGYAGICLPKDTKTIISLLKKLKLDFDLIKSIHTDNQKYKKTIFKGMRFGKKLN